MTKGKKKGVYWLSIEPESHHEEKVAALAQSDYEVTFFKTLDALIKELKTTRVATIIVGDEGPEVVVLKAISLLNDMPEIQGAKLILSSSRYSPTVLRLAACDSFRDILPIDLPTDEWLERFFFSTGRTTALMPPGSAPVLCQSPAFCAIPARLVWVNRQEIWLESRVFPAPGTTFSMTGPLAQSLGQKAIHLKVKRTEEKDLAYRFSMALVCSLSPSEEGPQDLLHLVKDVGTQKPIKTFLAVQSPALRGSLIRHLEDGLFQIRSALQKKSLIDEPQHFCPKLVIMEERLTVENGHSERFSQMMAVLSEDAVVLIIGEEDCLRRLQPLSHGRKLVTLKRIPIDFRTYVLQHLLPKELLLQHADAGTYYVPAGHEFSLAELRFPAIITRIDVRGASVALPHPVGVFGLARLESPLLEVLVGRFPYVKIAAQLAPRSDPAYPHQLAAAFCDVPKPERLRYEEALAKIPRRNEPLPDIEIAVSLRAAEPPVQQMQPQPQPQRLGYILFAAAAFAVLLGAAVYIMAGH